MPINSLESKLCETDGLNQIWTKYIDLVIQNIIILISVTCSLQKVALQYFQSEICVNQLLDQ